MIIGDRSQFAIEYELDENYGGHWLFGRVCLWVGGIRIGEYEFTTILRDLLISMEELIYNCGNRKHDELFALPTQKLYNRLNDGVYELENPVYEELAIKEAWERFDISIHLDVLDNWKMFMVEDLEQARMLIYDISKKELQEFKLGAGQFDNVIQQTCDEIHCLLGSEFEKMTN